MRLRDYEDFIVDLVKTEIYLDDVKEDIKKILNEI